MRKTIKFSDEASFLSESGKMFLGELQLDGSNPDAPEGVRRDWEIVAKWLGHTSGELSSESFDRLGKAWNAYLAIGLAPSAELQTAFDLFAKQVSDVPKGDRAPTEVMNVFDRLLATDEAIKAKRAADLEVERERFRPIFAGLKGENQQSWWRRQPPIVRNWLFASGVWMVLMFLYAMFFDPFDTGGWTNMSDDETLQFTLILFVPMGAGALFYIYQKWVK
jgi:hypothetical protein